ncbi:MAG TPA: YbgA family protein, partial [Vicinamibacterales bacterium]|nr:YbgA family protein [Vicinamibacterales bacterium]
GRHVNVLQHMAGYFDAVDADSRRELATTIADYGRGLVPLVVPLTLIAHHARRHDVRYLLDQVYLQPHPKELMLRNHV